jgi:hypothetical protein
MDVEEYLKKYPSEDMNALITRGRDISKKEYEKVMMKQANRIAEGREPSRTFQHVIDVYEATH